MQPKYISIGGRDSVGTEVFNSEPPPTRGKHWPAYGSRRLACGPAPSDQLGCSLKSLGSDDKLSGSIKAQETVQQQAQVSIFQTSRRLRGAGSARDASEDQRWPSSPARDQRASPRKDGVAYGDAGVSHSEIFGGSPRRLGRNSELPSPQKSMRMDMLGLEVNGEPTSFVPATPMSPRQEGRLQSPRSPRSPRDKNDEIHSPLSSRRMRAAVSGPPSHLHGAVSTVDQNIDLGQQEIFGSPRRKRSQSPPGRMMRWPGAPDKEQSLAEAARSCEKQSKSRGARVNEQLAKEARNGSISISITGEPSRLTDTFTNCSSEFAATFASLSSPKGGSMLRSATEDSGLSAIFGTGRRQLSPGRPGGSSSSMRTAGRASKENDANEDARSFCWAPTPQESSPRSFQPSGDEQWPSNRQRRLARSGSPRNDQLDTKKGLFNSRLQTQDAAGMTAEQVQAAAQANIFGSTRRQSRPAHKTLREGSPSSRMWRWLGTSDTSPSERTGIIF